MIVTPLACALAGAVLPFTPIADSLGFAPLPARFFLILGVMTVVYLVLVESAKQRFYAAQRGSAVPAVPVGPRQPLSEVGHQHRHRRRISRRARHFTDHTHPAHRPRRPHRV